MLKVRVFRTSDHCVINQLVPITRVVGKKKLCWILYHSLIQRKYIVVLGFTGSPLVKVSKESIDSVDEEKRSVSYSVIEGDLLKYYCSFKGHIVVAPKEEGCLVKWTCEYERVSDDVEVPHVIKDFVVKNFKEVDELALAA
ncbi:unnamed protein product [Linum tenue]|uniref:Bet v I/Major latex protein domain-containing protein n=1 Tax=Linum tenue TaxID=586396 RepID=A0AAV0H5Y3_9ROSI|nr:unnamed protein product [Linum tenue]